MSVPLIQLAILKRRTNFFQGGGSQSSIRSFLADLDVDPDRLPDIVNLANRLLKFYRANKFTENDFSVARHWVDKDHKESDGVNYSKWASAAANLVMFLAAEGESPRLIYEFLAEFRHQLDQLISSNMKVEFTPGKPLQDQKIFYINDDTYRDWQSFVINPSRDITFKDSRVVFNLQRIDILNSKLGEIAVDPKGIKVTHFSRNNPEFDTFYKLAFDKMDKIFDANLTELDRGYLYEKALYLSEIFYLITNLHPWERGGSAINRAFFSGFASHILKKKTIISAGADLYAMLCEDQNEFIRSFASYLAYGYPMNIPGAAYGLDRSRKKIEINLPDVNILNLVSGKSTELTEFLSFCSSTGESFIRNYNDPLNPKEPLPENLPSEVEISQFNKWYKSEQGKVFQIEFANEIVRLMNDISGFGHPGHDKRHILFADPTTALMILDKEDASGYNSLSLVGCLFHDLGRLLETSVLEKNVEKDKINHAEVSFGITSIFLEKFKSKIPESIRNEILYSILVHSTGNAQASFYAQMVQTSDRIQLINSETVPRHVGYFFSYFDDARFLAPIKEDFRSTISFDRNGLDRILEFYIRNIYPSNTPEAKKITDQGIITIARFLKIISNDQRFEQIFYPEILRAQYSGEVVDKRILPLPLYQRMLGEPHQDVRIMWFHNTDSLEVNLDKLLSIKLARHPKDVTHHKNAWEHILHLLSELSNQEKLLLNNGIKYILAEIHKKDQDYLSFLTLKANSNHLFISILARFIKDSYLNA